MSPWADIRHERRSRGFRVLETSCLLPLDPESVFPFFADAGNLQRITPPELAFRILTPTPIAMGPGTLIEYRLRLFGVPFRWLTRIAEWEPPLRFVDEQLRGPYHTWRHLHEFTAEAGGTRMTDRVTYRMPAHPLGGPALPLVRRQLERIFRFRADTIRTLLAPSA